MLKKSGQLFFSPYIPKFSDCVLFLYSVICLILHPSISNKLKDLTTLLIFNGFGQAYLTNGAVCCHAPSHQEAHSDGSPTLKASSLSLQK